MSEISLSFFGGAREVTGACYLLEVASPSRESKPTRILVDCGMFQGCDDCDIRTHDKFPFDPKSVDAVIITHAHIDHIGRLPKLIREGFRGVIYATAPTRDLTGLLLEDAMNFFKPGEGELFSHKDLEETMRLFHAVEYGRDVRVGEATFQLLEAGHILGSAFIRFTINGKIIVFTGDIGNDPSILLPPRAKITEAHVLIVESTYGNTNHANTETRALLLERTLEDVAARRGVLMMPVFATERTQEILYEVNAMIQSKRVPAMPIFLDSPLAVRTTEVFSRYPQYYREEVRALWQAHPHLFSFKHLKFTPSVAESKAINDVAPPKVILAGSGMSTGGRILHHEKRYLPDPKSILLITGYQAPGSLGRRLIDHAAEVKIHGEFVRVEAEIRKIDGYSAHADQRQLLEFVDEMRDSLEHVFVVQGEPAASLAFQQVIQDHFGIPATTPTYASTFSL